MIARLKETINPSPPTKNWRDATADRSFARDGAVLTATFQVEAEGGSFFQRDSTEIVDGFFDPTSLSTGSTDLTLTTFVSTTAERWKRDVMAKLENLREHDRTTDDSGFGV
jgi:hypothetical protein